METKNVVFIKYPYYLFSSRDRSDRQLEHLIPGDHNYKGVLATSF